jgi:hypothetical protein
MTTEQTSAVWQQPPQTMAPRPSLWVAAKANDAAELARLLDEGGSIDTINERDHRGYAPLMLAAYAGNLRPSSSCSHAAPTPTPPTCSGTPC